MTDVEDSRYSARTPTMCVRSVMIRRLFRALELRRTFRSGENDGEMARMLS